MGNIFKKNQKQKFLAENPNIIEDQQQNSLIKAIAINSPSNFSRNDSKYSNIETINFYLGFKQITTEEIIHIADLLHILPQSLRVVNFMLQDSKISSKGWNHLFTHLKELSQITSLKISLDDNKQLNASIQNFKALGQNLPLNLNQIYLNLNYTSIDISYIEEFVKQASKKPNLNNIRLLTTQLNEGYLGYFFDRFDTWFQKPYINDIYFSLNYKEIQDYDVPTYFAKFLKNIPKHFFRIQLVMTVYLKIDSYQGICQKLGELLKEFNKKEIQIFQIQINYESEKKSLDETKNVLNIVNGLHSTNLQFFQLVTQYGIFTLKDNCLDIQNIRNISFNEELINAIVYTRLNFSHNNLPPELNNYLTQKMVQISFIAAYNKYINPILNKYTNNVHMKCNYWDLYF